MPSPHPQRSPNPNKMDVARLLASAPSFVAATLHAIHFEDATATRPVGLLGGILTYAVEAGIIETPR